MTDTAARFIGSSVLRREDPRLLSGHGMYVDDIVVADMLHAHFVRSPVARGRITSIDRSSAVAMPGVVAVYAAEDLSPLANESWSYAPPAPDFPYPPQHLLAAADVRFVGDPVAIVVATDKYVAEDATDAVVVEIEAEPPILTVHEALNGSALVHPEFGSNLAKSISSVMDDAVATVFADAAHVVTETIDQQRQSQAPLEPRGIIAHWRPYSGDLRIYGALQGPHWMRGYAARLLGVSDARVHVSQHDVGGGFGQKVFAGREDGAVIMASRLLGRPVKWIEDRRENLYAASQARDEIAELSIAFDDQGAILGMKMHYVEDVGAYPQGGVASVAGLVAVSLPGPYRVPIVAFSSQAVFTNTTGRGAYRGPWMMENLAREHVLDLAAQQMGIDPVELRRRNLLRPDELPATTSTGAQLEDITPTETFDQALTMLGYHEFRAQQAAAGREGRLLGLGVSLVLEPSAVAAHNLPSDGATMRVEPDGRVQVAMPTGSHGHSLETTVPQLVADWFGVDIDDVDLVQGDTVSAPFGHGTGGSRSAVFTGGLARAASIQLREKVFAIAANLLEAAPEDLEMAAGEVFVKGSLTSKMPLSAIARVAYFEPDRLPENVEPGLEVVTRFASPKPFTWSNACHVCTCEIDRHTGRVRLLRYIVSEDCGVMINPMVVEGQIAGGVAQGIAGVLLEHLPYDAEGNPQATTLLDYLMPTASDVPLIEYGHIETPSSLPGGFKGMGEGGAIGAPAAVANAVLDALSPFGVPRLTFPVTPATVLELIRASSSTA